MNSCFGKPIALPPFRGMRGVWNEKQNKSQNMALFFSHDFDPDFGTGLEGWRAGASRLDQGICVQCAKKSAAQAAELYSADFNRRTHDDKKGVDL